MIKKQLKINTARLLLRNFRENDFEDLFEYLSQEITYKYEPGKPISREEAISISHERAIGKDFIAVELKEERKLIGHVYFKAIEPEELKTWELGYIFNPKYQRMGYATESVKAIIKYGFEDLRIHRIFAHCNPKNRTSWKLLERVGMRREGSFKKNIFFVKDEKGNPCWKDTYEYALLSEEINGENKK